MTTTTFSRQGVPFPSRAIATIRSIGPLLHPLWLRERRDRRLTGLFILSVSAAIVAVACAWAFDAGYGAEQNNALRQTVGLTSVFGSLLGAVFAVVAVILPIDRLTSMRNSGWCLPAIARGTPPASIVVGTCAAVAAGILTAFTASYLVFACGSVLAQLSDARSLLLGYVAVAPALLAWTSFGTLVAVVTRQRVTGIGLAATAVIVPTLWVTAWTQAKGHAPPTVVGWIWAFFVPVPLHVASWPFALERVRYAAFALIAVALLSRRCLVPND